MSHEIEKNTKNDQSATKQDHKKCVTGRTEMTPKEKLDARSQKFASMASGLWASG